LKVEFSAVTSKEMLPPGISLDEAVHRGGVWGDAIPGARVEPAHGSVHAEPPVFSGDPTQYPFLFQPYPSLQFHEGAGANLPWLQELPDPVSSAIWGLPVEIDPQLASRLRVVNGDMVRVESQHGWLQAPAYVHPGAIPGVVSMAIGDGHVHYDRYASGRGANPLSILAPVWEQSTETLAIGATRVRVARLAQFTAGSREWIQFAAPDREQQEGEHR
jgi:anaerobic selenocysteine-containing dehydrogenase